MNRRPLSCFSILSDFLIDLALIGMGSLIYYHFNIQPLAPLDWNPIVIRWFGSKQWATLILGGAPIVIGLLSFMRTMFRMAGALRSRSST